MNPSTVVRRLLRFRLRTLLLFVLVVSVPLGWLGFHIRQSQRQANAVARIERLGGTVYYDFHYYTDETDGSRCIAPSREAPSRRWPRSWLGDDFFHRVIHVQFVAMSHFESPPGMVVTFGPAYTPTELCRRADDEIACLKALPHLRTLDLSYSNVTDTGMQRLASLSGLQSLNLQHTQVTRQSVERLKTALPNCEITATYRRPDSTAAPLQTSPRQQH